MVTLIDTNKRSRSKVSRFKDTLQETDGRTKPIAIITFLADAVDKYVREAALTTEMKLKIKLTQYISLQHGNANLRENV